MLLARVYTVTHWEFHRATEVSTAKANYPPYGVDFGFPTGRFTNNKTVADVLGQLLGVPNLLPCFSNPSTKGPMILSGVNYASSASGILDSTNFSTEVITFNQQIRNFESRTLPELRSLLGKDLSSYLSRSIFAINTGGNDFACSCFDGTACYLPEFTEELLGRFTQQLKWLYGLGARKFALLSIQVSGCTPAARLTTTDGSCNETYNLASMQFNTRLNASIDRLTRDMPGSHFVFANSYKIISEMIDSPADYGLTVVDKHCCTVSGALCEKNGSVCEDRNTYLFFDGGHPTNAANLILARRMYLSDSKSDVYPFNIKHLADLSPDPDASGAGLSSEAPTMDMINELSVEGRSHPMAAIGFAFIPSINGRRSIFK
ncbi:GDSL esterase/lipase At1g29670-like isoform X2 [Nymphaea colorata]|uniref:GDSL esterase/lipase At1g29670-like isoform X2 n=1 Tax=Nymphaea colorata TaxID=210225 RepID=UPI00129D6B3D|nr:GDSL esterase/lipase At1g29670-like isoform X2 [Nymphaea colorata]